MTELRFVDAVKQGPDAIDAWRESHPGEMLYLIGARLLDSELAGANLSNARLDHASMGRSNLDNADLSDSSLQYTFLINAKLRNADLTKCHLYETFFTYADLSGARFWGAELDRTTLSGAKLSNADFSFAKFQGTYLFGADLQNACFTGATIDGAHLDGADLSGAVFDGTRIVNTDLSTCVGLENARHLGPSSIGVDTLYESMGKIPIAFLRGCGLPELMLDSLASLIGWSSNINDLILITHTAKDAGFACRLHDELQQRGTRCWLKQEEQLLSGADRYEDDCDKLIMCISGQTLSRWRDAYTDRMSDNLIAEYLEEETNAPIRQPMTLRPVNESGGDEIDDLLKYHFATGSDTPVHKMALLPIILDRQLFESDSRHAARLCEMLVADFSGTTSNDTEFDEQVERVIVALRCEGEDR